jgi:hypothetical protein
MEVKAETAKMLNFCLLCHTCADAIEKGLDLKEYRKTKRESMKRCADCLSCPG